MILRQFTAEQKMQVVREITETANVTLAHGVMVSETR